MKQSVKALRFLLLTLTSLGITSFVPTPHYPFAHRLHAAPSAAAAAALPSATFTASAPVKPGLHTIIIDPGHGGFDPGCHGLFSKEKNVTLAISLKLGKAIEENFPNVKIVYTRTTDIMPGNAPSLHEGLRARAEIANKSRGDLFLCIHANATVRPAGTYESRHVTGYKWVGKGKKKKKIAIYESHMVKNTVVGTSSFIWKASWGDYKSSIIGSNSGAEEDMGDSLAAAPDMTSPEAQMRAKLYEKKYFANSALLATLIQKEFVESGRRDEGIQQREKGIWVLEATGMPSVLVETGYLTNEEEEKYLNSDEGQDEVVQDLINALKKYAASIAGGAAAEKHSSDE